MANDAIIRYDGTRPPFPPCPGPTPKITDVIAEAVTDWLDAHPEATTTVQDDSLTTEKYKDGSVTEEKLSSELKLKAIKDYVTPQMFGIYPDTGADLYDALFDMMHTLEEGTRIYFPKGKYMVSDVILVPDGCEVWGDGEATEIYYTAEYSSVGVGFANGGSNTYFHDMKFNHYTTRTAISQGPMVGAVSFGTFDFNSWTTKHQLASAYSRIDMSNLKAENLYSDSLYLIQTEPDTDHTIENVEYISICAPNSMVSATSNADDGHLYNVVMSDISCSFLRIGMGDGVGEGFLINNVNCQIAQLNEPNTIVSNLVCDCSEKDLIESSYMNFALFLGAHDITVNNARVVGGNGSQKYAIAVYSGNYTLSNMTVEGGFDAAIARQSSTTGYAVLSNCTFDETYTGIKLPGGGGRIVNCEGSFEENTKVKNLDSTTQRISIAANGSKSVEFSYSAFVVVGRKSATDNPLVAFVDQWDGVSIIAASAEFSVTSADKTLTITNSSGSYCNAIIVKV